MPRAAAIDDTAFELLGTLTTRPLGFDAIKAEHGWDDATLYRAIRECQRMRAGVKVRRVGRTVQLRPESLGSAQLKAEAHLERTYN